ncbi:MAG: DUF2156 domain-containing protein [Clostridia bacterium]|nr:DUF2156 domain-containing protein [Clostridia bacterium]
MLSLTKLNFEPVELNHADMLKAAFSSQKYRISSFTAGSAIMWQKIYNIRVCEAFGCVILVADYPYEGKCYSIPVGGDVKAAINAVYDECKNSGEKCIFSDVPEGGLELLKEIFGEKRLKISTDDGWSDYLYNASDLITYSGKKFNGQRNHVNRFNRLYPDAVFEPLTRENFDEAYEFLKNYISQNGTTSESGELEGCAAIRLMKRYFDLNLYGAILKANNKIISLSIGEKVGDTLFVHVEKGLIEFSGVYQVMVQKFAETYAGDVLFINREEDDGVEGLRKSKLSYHPIGLLNKYSVEIT